MRSGLDNAEHSQVPSRPLEPSKTWPCLPPPFRLTSGTAIPTYTDLLGPLRGPELTLAPFHLQNEVQTAWLEQAPWEPALLLAGIISSISSALAKLPRLNSLPRLPLRILAVWAVHLFSCCATWERADLWFLAESAAASPVSSLAPVI